MKNNRTRNVIILAAAVVLAAAAILTGSFLARERRIEAEIDRKVAELLNRPGDYDERSIVLRNAGFDRARELADRLGAVLRITEDGSYAKLTLPEDKTVLDVFRDPEFRSEAAEMSADFKVSPAEVYGEIVGKRPEYSGEITDELFSKQYYFNFMNLSNVWDTTFGQGTVIAVIDTGIDYTHPEFAGKISEYSYNASQDKAVRDCLTDENDPESYDWSLIADQATANGHGTKVAGVIASSMDGSGIVGLASEATLLVIKAECDGNGVYRRTSDLIFGIYYAVAHHADVINMSFGGEGDDPFADALKLAVDSDVICVASAGNSSSSKPFYPAADPNCIGVGALGNSYTELASYSNYGVNTDLVAPGTTLTTANGGGYVTSNGTSFASPLVTGAVALYISQNRYIEYAELREVLLASCYDMGAPGKDYLYGYGVVDVSALVLEGKGTVTFDCLTEGIANVKQVFVRDHTIQSEPLPERTDAVFEGWYYDDQYLEKYNSCRDVLTDDLTLYAKWAPDGDGIPYTYIELKDGTLEISSYTGEYGEPVIPDEINGKTVTVVGSGAFSGRTDVTRVTLPLQLVTIKDNSFSGCESLAAITIPDSVTEIEEGAFRDAIALATVTFGSDSSLDTIGDFAFSGCSALVSFNVPKGVKKLDGSAFFGCRAMTSFSVTEGSRYFKADDGVLFSYDGTVLTAFPAGRRGTYVVPDTVENVGDYALGYTGIASVELSNVLRLGKSAFERASLESITVPDTVTTIGNSAFADNNALQTVELGHGFSAIPDGAFENDGSLKQITIPNTVKQIGKSEGGCFSGSGLEVLAFEEGSNLTHIMAYSFTDMKISSIDFPATLTVIETAAFANSGLTHISFGEPSSLQKIGDWAFAGCYITEVELPRVIKIIGEFAFGGNPLVSVSIPAWTDNIGDGAFACCPDLTSITVDEENSFYEDIDGVLFEKYGRVLKCYPIGNPRTVYTVPEGTKEIGKNAFDMSQKLTSVILPESLKYIREEAFNAVSKLTSISIPGNVTGIDRSAFCACTGLTSVILPDDDGKLAFIGCEAFVCCGIRELVIPASVSEIGEQAFSRCADLKTLTFAENSRLESIPAYMLTGCDSLKTVTFLPGSGLKEIQAHGFESLTGLETVDFGDAKPVSIGNYAFKDCGKLSTFDVPEGIEFLGRYAFSDCVSLAELSLPASLRHIGEFAFINTDSVRLAFAAPSLPEHLKENWDAGIGGYTLGEEPPQGDPLPGDADGDGEVTDWDAVLFDRYLAGWKNTGVNTDVLDLDKDGEISDWDAMLLCRYLAGWNIILN
ncbi:MAG: leucine-rich repeat protein [Clostridia bacterium]|nr:leucine-rich repeat protein [Clostridia bacterium]